jgi:hypothetical protein
MRVSGRCVGPIRTILELQVAVASLVARLGEPTLRPLMALGSHPISLPRVVHSRA